MADSKATTCASFGAKAELQQSRRSVQRANDVLPFIQAAQKAGCSSLREIAQALTSRGVNSPSGGDRWHAGQVLRVLLKTQASNKIPMESVWKDGNGDED